MTEERIEAQSYQQGEGRQHAPNAASDKPPRIERKQESAHDGERLAPAS